MLSTRKTNSTIAHLKVYFWNNSVPLGEETLRNFKNKTLIFVAGNAINAWSNKENIKEGVQLRIRSLLAHLVRGSSATSLILQFQKLIMILHRFACWKTGGGQGEASHRGGQNHRKTVSHPEFDRNNRQKHFLFRFVVSLALFFSLTIAFYLPTVHK